MTSVAEAEDVLLPPAPEEPLQNDCCGTGCTPCVFDIYEKELTLWREQCRSITDGTYHRSSEAEPNCQEPVIVDYEYRDFELIQVSELTHDTRLYRFNIPGSRSLGLATGQHVLLKCFTDNSRPITRQYTPISHVHERGYFDVYIKLYPDGKMSQCIRQWTVGQRIQWRGPFGEFIYEPNRYTKLYMFAAGTGLAPMLQILRTIMANENDETRVRLLYCVRSPSDILAKNLLNEWKSYWNFSVNYVISRETSDVSDVDYGDEVRFGRLNEEFVHSELRKFARTDFVCISGTKSFDKDLIKYCRNIAVPEENMHKF